MGVGGSLESRLPFFAPETNLIALLILSLLFLRLEKLFFRGIWVSGDGESSRDGCCSKKYVLGSAGGVGRAVTLPLRTLAREILA